MDTYKIIRFWKSGRRAIIKRGLSLELAQLHCRDPKTKGKNWFDGYENERGEK